MLIATEHIAQGGTNVPVTLLPDATCFDPSGEVGASRYAAALTEDIDLEALLVNKGSDVLLVAFHGALTRETVVLPRFERLAGFLKTDYSLLFFSDPTLRISDELQLSWYTGWDELDLRPVLAEWATKAAASVGAKHIIFFGGSGGGFASLQVSAFVAGSTAITINPQTAINEYLIEGIHMGPQRRYVRIVMPHLLPVPVEQLTMEHDWVSPMGERASAVKTYSRPTENRVLYIQNSNDHSHVTSHYGPFREAADSGPNRTNIRYEFYEGPHAHVAQPDEIISKSLVAAATWAATGEYTYE